MADEEKRPWPRSWIIGAVVVIVVVLLLLLVPRDDGRNAGGAADPNNGGAGVNRELCRGQLEDALEALRPSRLGITSSADDQAADLVNWWTTCGESGVEINVETDSLRPLLPPEVFERVISDRFDPRDAGHIRDCRLYRQVAVRIAAAHDVQIDRAQAAFNYVVRQVALWPPDAVRIPLPAQYAALFGRADASHRAWLMAELLRQLSIDCVIIEPTGDRPSPDTDIWLLGVIVPDEGVYLFDPAAGLAIPGDAGDSESGVRPATLTEARRSGDLLRRLDVPDGPAYPWTAEMLEHVSVRVIGDSSLWAARMARLQNRLPGEFAMTIFDGLIDTPNAPAGLLQRVRQAGQGGLWDEDDVSLWDFPEEQITAFYAAGGDEGAVVGDRMRVLRGPQVAVTQPGGVIVLEDSNRPLRLARLQQLSGDLAESLQGLGAVRSAAAANEANVVNALAKEDSVYWISLCQFEMHREEAALGNLNIYFRDYPFGVWLGAARALQSHCLARLGRYEEAAQAMLKKGDPGSPLSFGEAFLVRQWQATASETGEGAPDDPR